MNKLQRLHTEQDQSPWIDFIDRKLIDEGTLAELAGKGIRGLTSNPTIFSKAVATGQYDELVRGMLDKGASNLDIYEEIAVTTCSDAADVLRPVYDEAPGAGDGHISIEVEPGLADDGDGTLARARELWSRMARPNVFVKIPATSAGLPAIEQATADGINVNITLMFSVDVYRVRGSRVHRRAQASPAARRGRVADRVGRQLLRQSGGHQGRQEARGDRHAERAERAGQGGDRERQAGVRRLPGDLRRHGVRGPARRREHGCSAVCGHRPRPRTPSIPTSCTLTS